MKVLSYNTWGAIQKPRWNGAFSKEVAVMRRFKLTIRITAQAVEVTIEPPP
jgi:hypothetical protein